MLLYEKILKNPDKLCQIPSIIIALSRIRKAVMKYLQMDSFLQGKHLERLMSNCGPRGQTECYRT